MGKCNFRTAINLILKKDDNILLMRRYNTGWNDGMYALMGGHVEDGENPLNAVVREADEELGIEVLPKDLEHKLTMSVSPDHIYLYFVCSKFNGEVKNMEPNECDDIRFFKIDNLPDNIIGADKQALESIFGEQTSTFDTFGYEQQSEQQNALE